MDQQQYQQSRTQQDPGEQIHVSETGSGWHQGYEREQMTVVATPTFSYWLWPKPRPARRHEMESIRERRQRMTTSSSPSTSSSSGTDDQPPGNGHPSEGPQPPRFLSEGKKRGNGEVVSDLPPVGSSGGKSKRVLCRFGHDHVQTGEWSQDMILDNRDVVGIDRHWSIHVEVTDPDMIFQHAEGLISYDEEAYYALVTVRCDLPYDLLEWIVIHELFELKRYKSASAIQDWYHFQLREYDSELVRRQQVERFYRQIMKARNQEIEQEVYQYLGHHRPMHMPVTPGPGQPNISPLPAVLHSPPLPPEQGEAEQEDDEEKDE